VYDGFKKQFYINTRFLIEGLFASATVLISFGGVIGKISPTGLVIMAFIELMFYSLNLYIIVLVLKTLDVGGSIAIHIFGAYFGLTVAWIISPKESKEDPMKSSRYTADIFSIIGTVFLWMFWPSFNGAIAAPSTQQRVIVNTVLSQCGSCIASFFFSRLYRHYGKFEMEDIQNATVAGGVAIGSAADFIVYPGAAILVGVIGGTISTTGFAFGSNLLNKVLKLHDTCGIHNLHGMPGLLGGLVSVVAAGAAVADSTTTAKIGPEFSTMFYWNKAQAGIQAAAMGITLAIAILSGIFTGLILLGLRFIEKSFYKQDFFQDHQYFNIPEGYDAIGAAKKDDDANVEMQDTKV